MKALSRTSLIVSLVALLGGMAAQNASATDDVIRWQSINGIVQGGNIVGTGSGAVTGAPGPWSTLNGHVKVDLSNGRMDFVVQGLVLAGGNAIGTPGTVNQVRGTLVCDTDGSASGGVNSIIVDTPPVPLDEQGDARFVGTLTLPAVCSTEPDIAFLIRTVSNNSKWLANGTVLQ